MAFPNQERPGWQPPQPASPLSRPPALTRAVQFMWAGAVLGAAAAIASALSGFAYFNTYSTSSSGTTTVHSNPAVTAVIGVVIVVALWAWMAWKNGQGRSWARIVATVFFGIMCLDALGSLFEGARAPAATLTAILEWVAGLLALIYMWKAESGQYYAAVRAQRAGYPPVPPGYGYGQPGNGQPPAYGQPPAGEQPPAPYRQDPGGPPA